MSSKDTLLLEKTYLSIGKKLTTVPSDETVDPISNEVSDSDEPLSSYEDTLFSGTENDEPSISSEQPEQSAITISSIANDVGQGSSSVDDEYHEMVIDNLNSIRESIVRIADFCLTGQSLKSWQIEKLSIAMDNLAEVARRLR